SRTNSDGRYYTRKYYKASNPNAVPQWQYNTPEGLIPFSDEGPQLYKYQFSQVVVAIPGAGDYNWGVQHDRISKVGVLACMLIIGDKCCVETYAADGSSRFVWQKYLSLEECGNDEDRYYAQSFTIGVDPKIDDFIIGQEHNIQNNISFEMGIDAEGTAIPIRKDDHLRGAVQFSILGPVNSTWNNVIRRHPTFFRNTKFTNNDVSILAHVSNILIKEFEVKLYSDNGLINNWGDDDLVYISDTDERFLNIKDDIEFELCSGLTSEECVALGVPDNVNLTTVTITESGDAVTDVFDCTANQAAKPEQIYVDAYYTQLHVPRVTMTQTLVDDPLIVNPIFHYTHPALPGKVFFVQDISRNLSENSATLTLKEIPAND
ncbi:MAG: hypothetical protein HDT09_04130, partial [Bacteroidales bacterium]|nr:hypothetical protein [Bacteroidales bacterium]